MGATRPVRPLVVDSHSMIWFLQGHPKLSSAAFAALEDEGSLLLVPAICLCEIYATLRKGKYSLRYEHVREAVERSGRIEIVPIDYEITTASLSLSQLDGIHDQLIVATALQLLRDRPTLRVVTADAKILASNLVPILW